MVEMIAGTQRVSDLNQNQLVIDMEAKSEWLDQDSYIFETLTRKFMGGVQNATRMKHEYRERRLMSMTAITTAVANASATSIAVSNASIFYRDQLIFSPATDEMFAMDEDIGGTAVANAIKVRRITTATGTGIVSAIPSGSVLINCGESHAEGEDIPDAFATKEENFSTYMYQFDRTRESTDISNAEEKYGESEISKQRRQFWIEQKRALNMMLYVGVNTRETLSGDGRRHVMKGLIEYLKANAVDADNLQGGLTVTTIGTIIRPTKAHGQSSNVKVTIAGQNAWQSISAFPENFVRTTPGANQEWGVTLRRLITAFGDTDVGYDPMLSGEYGMQDRMFVIDPKHMYQMQMQGLPLVLMLNRQTPKEVHILRDVITGTRGLVCKLPELHRYVYGI